MADAASPGNSLRTDTVLEYLHGAQDAGCVACGLRVCGHEAVICLATGFKDSPRCLSCLASGLGRQRDELRDHLLAYVRHHECLRAGWDWASHQEGFDPASLPACLWVTGEEALHVTDTGNAPPGGEPHVQPLVHAEWDAGDMGCGDLVMELRMRLQAMKPGDILKIAARDPGAPEDFPAWCRLTGHTLVFSHHPEYWIKRKEE